MMADATYKKGALFFVEQIRQRKLFFLLMLLLTFGFSSMVSVSIFFLGGIVDAFITPSTVSLLGWEFPRWVLFFTLYVVASLAQYVFSLVKDRLEVILGSGIKQFYLPSRFIHILRLPFHFLKDKKKGELIGVTEEFASGFDRALNDLLSLLEIVVRAVFFVILIIVTISWANGLIYFVGMVIAFAISFKAAQRYRTAVGRRVDEVTATKGKSYDILNNYDVVKNFNTEQKEEGVLFKVYRKLRFFELKENSTYLKFDAFNLFIFQLFIFVNLGFGLFFLSREMISIGDVVALQVYSGFLFSLIVSGSNRYLNFVGFLFGVGKSEEIYDLEEEVYSAPNLIKPGKFIGEIKFVDVSFRYPDGDSEVLKDVSFTIRRGERVAITGSSGVGKTTIVNLLMGFYFPTKGEILVDGVSTKRLDLGYLRSNISVVPQDVNLFNETIGNNIEYGALNENSDVVLASKQAELDDFIAGLPNKYEQLVGERGVKLSGGQRQRVGIARAFVRNSQFIILDEPTSNLDSATEEKISNSFDNLLNNRTSLVIAHRLSTVKKADKILVFDKSRLVGEGKHDELVESNKEYKKLYELQIKK